MEGPPMPTREFENSPPITMFRPPVKGPPPHSRSSPALLKAKEPPLKTGNKEFRPDDKMKAMGARKH